jgi:oligopeptide transport system ATP-binding protein
MNGKILISAKNLVKYFPVYFSGIFGKRKIGDVHAVDNVSFQILEGETLALVGESGCGKTTTAKVILNIEPPTSGEAYFEGKNIYEAFRKKNKKEILSFKRSMQMIYQNPYSSLNPRMTVRDVIAEPFVIHKLFSEKEREERVYSLLKLVGLQESDAEKYPFQFSGGQRQRISIARALAMEPKFIVADEPVSSLDVSIRAQVLNLIKDLQDKLKLTYLYISHDLSSVRQISDRIAVMYLGKIVEFAEREALFKKPVHPYTQALFMAVPVPDPKRDRIKIRLPGEPPSPINPPPGCRFHPRCQYAVDKCKSSEPELVDIGEGHYVACHLSSKFI